MSEKTELDIIQPVDFVPVKGEKVFIRPFQFSKLNEFLSTIRAIAPGLCSALQKMEQDDAGNVILESPVTIGAMIELYMESQETIVELMTFYIDRDKEWFDDEEKGPDVFEGVALLAAIVVKNFDFFMSKLLPVVMAVMPRAAAATQKKRVAGRK